MRRTLVAALRAIAALAVCADRIDRDTLPGQEVGVDDRPVVRVPAAPVEDAWDDLGEDCVGCGPLGLSAVQGARIAGASISRRMRTAGSAMSELHNLNGYCRFIRTSSAAACCNGR